MLSVAITHLGGPGGQEKREERYCLQAEMLKLGEKEVVLCRGRNNGPPTLSLRVETHLDNLLLIPIKDRRIQQYFSFLFRQNTEVSDYEI